MLIRIDKRCNKFEAVHILKLVNFNNIGILAQHNVLYPFELTGKKGGIYILHICIYYIHIDIHRDTNIHIYIYNVYYMHIWYIIHNICVCVHI